MTQFVCVWCVLWAKTKIPIFDGQIKRERLKDNTMERKCEKEVQTMRNKMIGGWEVWKLSFPVQNLATLASNLILLPPRRRQEPYGDAWHISFFSKHTFPHRAKSALFSKIQQVPIRWYWQQHLEAWSTFYATVDTVTGWTNLDNLLTYAIQKT